MRITVCCFTCLITLSLITPCIGKEIEFPIISTPQISGDFLYAGSVNGSVYAIDKTTGKQLWEFKNRRKVRIESARTSEEGERRLFPYSFISSPALYKETVFITDLGGMVYAIDVRSGESKWSFSVSKEIGNRDFSTHLFTSTDIIGNVLLCGSQYSLCAFDLATRKVLWNFNSPNVSSISKPTLDGENILFSVSGLYSKETSVSVLDGKTGKILNKMDCGAEVSLTSPCVTEKEIWVGSSGFSSSEKHFGRIFSFERASGKLEFKSDELGAIPYYTKLIYNGDTIFFPSMHGLYEHSSGYFYSIVQVNALNLFTGEVIWKYQLGEDNHIVIGICDGKIMAGGSNRSIYVLDSNNGNLLWKCPVKGRINSDFVCDNHAVYFRTDSSFYAIDLGQKKILWEKELR